MTAATCGSGDGSGGLTITGIPSELNGRYAVVAQGFNSNTSVMVYGNQSSGILAALGGKGYKISNGRVTIPLFDAANVSSKEKYSGSDTLEYVDIVITK